MGFETRALRVHVRKPAIRHTDDVNGREVGRGAGRGPALPVEQRLGVKGEAPGDCVDPAEQGGQQGQECDHGSAVDSTVMPMTGWRLSRGRSKLQATVRISPGAAFWRFREAAKASVSDSGLFLTRGERELGNGRSWS